MMISLAISPCNPMLMGVASGGAPSLVVVPSTGDENTTVEIEATGPELAGASSVEAFDHGVSIGTDAGGAPWEFTLANILPGVHEITVSADAGPSVGPVNLTIAAAAPVLDAPGTSTVSIGDTVSFLCHVGAAGADETDDNTTSIAVYNGDPGNGGVLLGTDSAHTAGVWSIDWDTTGEDEADYVIWLRRAWSGVDSQTGTEDTNAGVTLTLEEAAGKHLITETIVTSATYNMPSVYFGVDGTTASQRFEECTGAGGSGTTNTGGGGGGAYAATTVDGAPSDALTVTIGQGAVGADGTDTSIDATTIAKGGLKGSNGGTGGTAAASTGDTKYGGGDGVIAAGTQVGGGSAGSAGAAAAEVPGPYDGARGTSGNAIRPGAGGGSSAGAGFTGGHGDARVSYCVPATAGFSYRTGRAVFRSTAGGTSHTVIIPPGTGGLLVAYVALGAGTTLSGTGWTALTQVDQGQVSLACMYRTADGSDPTTFTTSGTDNISVIIDRWISASGGVPGAPTWTTASGSSTDANPPSHTPAAGSANYAWVACCAVDSGNAIHVTSGPSGFSSWRNVRDRVGGGATLSVADKFAAGTVEDPGVFTTTNEQWCAATISIPPA